jgi:hypothetical protein
MAAALQVWSATYSKAFDALSVAVQESARDKVDELGTRLRSFPHKRLKGRPNTGFAWANIGCFTNSI